MRSSKTDIAEVQSDIPESEAMATCAGGAITTTGNSAVSGSYGNIRTFSGGGVSVKVSAFSRKNSTGAWETAFLGAFSTGLGVTNRGENGNNNTHKVDNIGDRVDFVLFEFDKTIVVDRAFLDSIGADSDATVWIGTASNPYNNHLTLSDGLLGSFGDEDNDTTSSSSRWADFNSSGESGNVLVISGSISDATPDDEFKIRQLDIQCTPSQAPCVAGVFNMEGNSAGSGTAGNIRTYTTAGGLKVKASGFSRRKSDGLWETAYLGVYGGGLGVTDRGEGDGGSDRHKLDNIGDRDNYILFEFDQTVVVDRAFLDSVGADSDATVWIGSSTSPYHNHLTLNDGLLTGFGSENNNASNNLSRWANINSAGEAGNVLVIAASTSSSTKDDAFKVRQLDVKCPGTPAKITIIKEVQGMGGATSSSQSFPFTATNFGLSNFSLTDQNSVGPDRVTNNEVYNFGPANAVTVTESLINGWTLLSIKCVETGGIANSTVNLRTATIIVEPGENVVCTFKNAQGAPTAATVTVSGRVMSSEGMPISGAMMVLTNASTGATRTARTNPFGYYMFEGLESTEFYSLTVSHKRYVFAPDTQYFTLLDDFAEANFVAID